MSVISLNLTPVRQAQLPGVASPVSGTSPLPWLIGLANDGDSSYTETRTPETNSVMQQLMYLVRLMLIISAETAPKKSGSPQTSVSALYSGIGDNPDSPLRPVPLSPPIALSGLQTLATTLGIDEDDAKPVPVLQPVNNGGARTFGAALGID